MQNKAASQDENRRRATHRLSRITYHEARVTDLVYDSRGLMPAVVQDATSGEVLMVAWMNGEALQRTRETGEVHFWSRRRSELWRKGATSGNVLRIEEMRVDCDGDTLLLRVHPAGPACHTGARSCFFRTLEQTHAG